MTHHDEQSYIDGHWITPGGSQFMARIHPATGEQAGRVILADEEHADLAVRAARKAFSSWSLTPVEERLALLDRIGEVYRASLEELADAVAEDMGAPAWLARGPQVQTGLDHLGATREALAHWQVEQAGPGTRVVSEPIGVCALITPWNWPINQMTCKVFPALAAGCTMVLKPSEFAARTAGVFAGILHRAGVPAGVFNLVHGRGEVVGAALARHPGVDMVSFTGSTAAGIAVAQLAATTVKRVTQELGGKSPYVICPDAPLADAVPAAVQRCFTNSGQTCTAPTRLLVPRDQLEAVEALVETEVARIRLGTAEPGSLGPLVNQRQFERAQRLIETAVSEGARLLCGGPGRPAGLEAGCYVRPTVFTDVHNDMTIAREEVFGPVLCILPYDTEEEAIALANDTVYGLAAYVYAGDLDVARRVASRLQAGMVYINEAPRDIRAPFGGYKQSGNGREWGRWGLAEFFETKAILGWHA